MHQPTQLISNGVTPLDSFHSSCRENLCTTGSDFTYVYLCEYENVCLFLYLLFLFLRCFQNMYKCKNLLDHDHIQWNNKKTCLNILQPEECDMVLLVSNIFTSTNLNKHNFHGNQETPGYTQAHIQCTEQFCLHVMYTVLSYCVLSSLQFYFFRSYLNSMSQSNNSLNHFDLQCAVKKKAQMSGRSNFKFSWFFHLLIVNFE